MKVTSSPVVQKAGPERVFAALLRYWRRGRGLSQLDLALTADVSTRHISFLETARSKPSVEMVRLLAEALDIPLRNRNDLLRAAGFAAEYPEPEVTTLLAGPLGKAIETMGAHHEPYPMMVINGQYDVVRVNHAGRQVLQLAGVEHAPGDDAVPVNLLRIMFDPEIRALFANWESAAANILRRLQREVLQRPQDEALAELLAELLADDAVPSSWRQPDPSIADEPMLVLRFSLGTMELGFLTTITAFNAPQNVTLDELRIESWFPEDDATAAACATMFGSADGEDLG